MNLIETLNLAYNILKTNKIESYKIDAEILLCDILKTPKEKLFLNLDQKITRAELQNFIYLINRRKIKEPIAYLVKKKEFWKNDFYVNKNVLIPRPETEYIVEASLEIINKKQRKRILEIGIGSGCVLTSILKERKYCVGVGIDCSKKALNVAKFNANLHNIKNRIKIIKSDVDNFSSSKYDLIISNPPYIDKHYLKYLGVSTYEPKVALDGGINGTEILMKVIYNSSNLLKKNGKLIIEIGLNQKYKLIDYLKKNKFFINKVIKDLAKNDRCIISTKIS